MTEYREKRFYRMNEKQKEIAENFFSNAEKLSYGCASVELKIHGGRCVGVIYTTSVNIRQKESIEDVRG